MSKAGDAEKFFKQAKEFARKGEFALALQYIDRAISLTPDNPALVFTKAMIYEGGQRYEDALPLWKHIVAVAPMQPAGWYFLGRVYGNLKMRAECIENYRKALELNPTGLEILVNLSDMLMQHKLEYDSEALQKGIEEARVLLETAVLHHPNSVEALTGLGHALQRLGRSNEALPYFERSYSLAPENKDVVINLAYCFSQLGQFAKAEEVYRRGIALGDWYAEFSLAQLLLLQGRWEEGLKAYEARFHPEEVKPRDFPYPRWNGESLADKTLLVWAEQGIGDELMFASLLPDIASQCKQLVIEVEPRLVSMFTRSFPRAEVVSRRMTEDTQLAPIHPIEAGRSDIDYQVSMGGLMGHAKARLDAGSSKGYLSPDPALVERYKERYQHFGNTLKIGLSWKSNRTETSRLRSLALKEWLPIFKTGNTQFFNFQYGNYQHEIDALTVDTGINIISDPEIDPLKDMEHMAALMATMDLVISCANSTVHLAGSIGTPVWVLTPKIPSWRWLLNRDDSVWYPHVKLFRQSELWRWDDVVQRIADELKEIKPFS